VTAIVSQADELRYQTGFGNEFATEALPGALPQGRNSPQRCAYGLYAEQLSGTSFTAPRAVNRRSWLYRIRPAVSHQPFVRLSHPRFDGAPNDAPIAPNQLRWDPLPFPASPADFVEGLVPVASNGSAQSHCGCAIHLYAAGEPMQRRFFYSADGEMLIVPQHGPLTLDTELGRMEVEPLEIAVIPRGVRFRVGLRELRGALQAPGSRADRGQRACEPAGLQDTPRALRRSRPGLRVDR
jgi:homogentisate 1,2-dioxygenase